MKKVIKVTAVLLRIVLIGIIGFNVWSAKIVKEAMELSEWRLCLF